MFRKRDNDPMENEGDKGAEAKAEPKVELRPEADAKPDAEPQPKVDVRPEASDQPKADPGPEAEMAPNASEEPEATAALSDDPTPVPDMPEIEPLSAVSKPAAANASPSASSDPQANKRLIVGQGIRLSGEINSCDRLVVEGEVEVTLNDTLALEITSSGRFTGGCEVEEADISGIYEGDLTVRNTLFVRGTGRITGTIRYGQLELERGGQIAGNISVLGNDSPAAGSGDKVRSAKAPLFGSS